jgi:hypothetical protein
MSTDKDWTPPQSAEELDAFINGLTFLNEDVPEDQIPPRLGEQEDVTVPQSFRMPVQLAAALTKLAEAQGVTKTALVVRWLEDRVAAEMLADGSPDVLVSLADVLRAVTGLRHLPRSA